MTPAGRTKGPWIAVNPTLIRGPHGEAIAATRCRDIFPYDVNHEANAAFIVEACNAHDSLTAENARLREALYVLLKEHGEMNTALHSIGRGRTWDGAHPDCPTQVAKAALGGVK